jgi:hypothetical protein
MSGRTFRESRTLTRAQVDQMNAAALLPDPDYEAWSGPILDAMNDAMEEVKRRMVAAGMRPNPGAYSFSIVFEAEGVDVGDGLPAGSA